MSERIPGRYNLHRLGWKSFEDLVVEINRTILGETVTPFRVGADGGRDAFFVGKVSGAYTSGTEAGADKLVVQCKHTSATADGFKWSDVSAEVPKVLELVNAGEVDIFVIFSNRRLAADDEKIIRSNFEKLTGVRRCLVMGEEWIESHIDGNFRLLRRVPRLFGVGDLSQILSHSISQQTRLILDEMQQEQAVFVPTPSYQDAVSALERHNFVVLVGPAASGKSAIALNLCMVLGAEHEDLEVLRLEAAEQFSSTISASDPNKLFWIDDFLGETSYDDRRATPMMAAFDKFRAALNNGNRFIFTSRDYILKDSHNHLRKSKLDFFEHKSVIVRVDNLGIPEKERILYNHIKLGDLDGPAKRSIKSHLPMLARLPGFTPELARRLGTQRFHANLRYDKTSLIQFVENPVHFFLEVIHDLRPSEQATIALLLLSNNSLVDPITDVPAPIMTSYGVDASDIRRSLEALRGSLTKLNVVGGNRIWQVHHPTMIDAMHEHLRTHATMLDLFVAAAPTDVILRDCATTDSPHQLFIPKSLYERLWVRVSSAPFATAAKYIDSQGDDFILYCIENHPIEMAEIMGRGVDPLGPHWGLRLLDYAITVLEVKFDAGRKAIEENLEYAVWDLASSEALHHEDFKSPLDDSALLEFIQSGEDMIASTLGNITEDAINEGNSTSASDLRDHISTFQARFSDAATRLLEPEQCSALLERVSRTFKQYLNRISEVLEEWDYYTYDSDEWRGGSSTSAREPDTGIFSDVDD